VLPENPTEAAVQLSVLDNQSRLEAMHRVAEVTQEAFGVEPYNEATGKGLTVSESLELLASFYEYANALKKNTVPSPSSLPPMESVGHSPTPKQKESFFFGDASSGSEPNCSSKSSPQPSAT